jgi:hypothetical protein
MRSMVIAMAAAAVIMATVHIRFLLTLRGHRIKRLVVVATNH